MNSPPSACLVLNGKASARDDVRAAVHAVRGEGHRIEVRVTWERGDATRFARQAAETGSEIVVAGGGDGTINEVVGGLMDAAGGPASRPSLGVMPLGTANDLAHSCGIPMDPLVALRLALSTPAVAVDVGRANGRHFLNVATGGFGTQVTAETPAELKKALGGVAYLLTGLTHFTSIRPARGRLSGPGLEWQGAFLVLAVGNGRQAGGGYQLCPDAILTDGLFDVRVVPQLPAVEFARSLGSLFANGLDAVRQKVVGGRVPWLEVETDEPFQTNLDGEPMTATRVRYEVLPHALQMKLPPGSPLVA